MISVLIADDEYLIRQLVKKSVNWSEFDMNVMWEAGDGREALQIIRRYLPDVAIVDINMPFVNGIDLARAVYAEELPTQVLFLTGYQEFEYARKAIEYKVFDYILKPIRPEELEQVLGRMEEYISQNRQLWSRKEIPINMEEMELLHRIVAGESEKDEKMPERWGDIFRRDYRVLVVRPDGVQQLSSVQPLLFQMLQESWLFLEKECGCAVIGYVEYEYDRFNVMVIPESVPQDERGGLRASAELLRKYFEQSGEYTATIGISGLHCGAQELNNALREGRKAASCRFNGENNTVYVWDEGFAEREPRMRQEAQNILELLESSKRNRIDRRDVLGRMFELLKEKKLDESYVKTMAARALARTLTFRENEAPETPFSHFYGQIMRCEHLEEIEKLCYQWIGEEEGSSRKDKKKFSSLVQNSKTCIEQNYTDCKLSLNQIASVVNASPSYLSNLFKQEMGSTITEYITICRMNRAAEVLNDTPDCTLAELAEQVGYNDPYYFSRSFKKFYGISPLRYRLENDN